MAAAVVCARAMVRDLYEPHQGARVMSLGLSGLGVLAIAAPAARRRAGDGAGLAQLRWPRWRVFVPTLVLVVRLARGAGNAGRARPAAHCTARRWPAMAAQVAAPPDLPAWALLVAATYGGLFTLLAGLVVRLHRGARPEPAQYGLAMASGSLAYIVGTFLCRRWLLRQGLRGSGAARRAVHPRRRRSGMAAVRAGAGVRHGAAGARLPHWLYTFGHGIHQPCGQTGAVGPFPQTRRRGLGAGRLACWR